jgi:hypothetical protein
MVPMPNQLTGLLELGPDPYFLPKRFKEISENIFIIFNDLLPI